MPDPTLSLLFSPDSTFFIVENSVESVKNSIFPVEFTLCNHHLKKIKGHSQSMTFFLSKNPKNMI